MIVQEILKIMRRRGMFWSACAIPLVAVVAVLVIDLIIRANNSDNYIGGQDLLEAHSAFIGLAGFIMAALVGAQAGAYDVANGTFRYLVMTGRSRLSLYLARWVAFAVVMIIAAVPALLVASLSVAVLPNDGDPSAGFTDHVTGWWSVILPTLVYGSIALGVGALLKSVGAAIAVALVLNFGSIIFLPLLTLLNERIDDFLLSGAVTRILGEGESSLILAIVVALVWTGAFFGAGALRTVRAEY
jgi:ABC-type transport system involved in multi-copper enzyme maturation permease subunit